MSGLNWHFLSLLHPCRTLVDLLFIEQMLHEFFKNGRFQQIFLAGAVIEPCYLLTQILTSFYSHDFFTGFVLSHSSTQLGPFTWPVLWGTILNGPPQLAVLNQVPSLKAPVQNERVTFVLLDLPAYATKPGFGFWLQQQEFSSETNYYRGPRYQNILFCILLQRSINLQTLKVLEAVSGLKCRHLSIDHWKIQIFSSFRGLELVKTLDQLILDHFAIEEQSWWQQAQAALSYDFLTVCSQCVDLDLHRSACLICLCSWLYFVLSKLYALMAERGSHWLDLNMIRHTHQNYRLANFLQNKIFFKFIYIFLLRTFGLSHCSPKNIQVLIMSAKDEDNSNSTIIGLFSIKSFV